MAADTADIAELTATQQEVLQTYTAITDQEPAAAIPILRRAEWNVQIAITRFFEGEPTTDPVAEAQAAIPPPTSRQTANLQYESLLAETRRPPRAPSTDTVQRIDSSTNTISQYQPGLVLSLLLTPINILYRVFSTVFSPLSFVLPPFILRIFNNLFSAPRPHRRPLPPAETAHRFIREFSETYPSGITLPWIESGFNLGLDNAKKAQKFLIVVLLSPSHDETLNYVSETLLSPTFRSFLQSHSSEVLLWGGNVQDSEAYQVATNLNCTKFPFVALVCQTPTTPSSTTASGGNMTVVLRAVGPMTASELTAKLGTAMTNHQTALRAARAQQAEQQASRSLRQEQDSAYERSLAQDRERARKRKEEEEAKRKAEEEARRKIEDAERLKQKREQWRRWRATSIPNEPDSATSAADTIRVSIRMTDGERVIRKFHSNDQVEDVYAFVDCHSVQQSEGESEEKPEGYEHEYAFQLVSPMPRTVYDLSSGGTVGKVIGKGANLIVEMRDEDDDDDDGEDIHAEGSGLGNSTSTVQTSVSGGAAGTG